MKHAIKEVVNFCFKDKQGKYIEITKYDETWVNDTNKHKMLFDEKPVKLAIIYLLDQCFFTLLAV